MLHSLILDILTPKRRWRSEETQSDPAERRPQGWGADTTSFRSAWLVSMVLIAACALLLPRYLPKPVLRLKPEPPTWFVSIGAQNDINEVEWAREYWRCILQLQYRYVYAAPLPDEPPPQFHIPEERTLPRDKADKFRHLYWGEVQKAWLNPDTWETSRSDAYHWLPNW